MKKAKAHPHEKPHHPHWPLACVLLFFVFALGMLSVHEPATWIHIRTGARIVADHSIPRTDPYSYTVAGRFWTTDSWLADILFYVANENFGSWGLTLLKSLVAAAGFALLLPLNFASPLTAAAVLALGAVSAWTGLTEMPGVFDLLLLASLIRVLRPRRAFGFATLAKAAALVCLWANLHGTTAVLGLWVVGLKVFKASLRTEKGERLGHWALFAAAFLALAANPHGLAVIGHMFSGLEASTTAWQPLSPYLNLYNFFCLAGAAGCVVTLQQEFFLATTAATALGLSLLVPQMRPLAILACCPVVSLALGHFTKPQDDDWPRVARFGVFLAALAGLHWLCVTLPLGNSRGYGAVSLDGAVNFLKSNGVRGRMFNEVESGALLIGAGERPVFVDARAQLYGLSFMNDALRWPTGLKGLSEIYGFDYAVILNRRARYPARALDEDPDWRLGYADDASLVYVRRRGASGWLVKGWPPSLLKPNRLWPDEMDAALADPKKLGKLIAELDQWIAQTPDSAQALIWKAYALDRRKLSDKAERLLRVVAAAPRLSGDPELSAQLGLVYDLRGEAAPARRLYRRAGLIARRRGDWRLEAEILGRLAASYRRAGDAAQAQTLERRAGESGARALAEEL